MIARIAIPIILATVLCNAYIDYVFWRKRFSWWKRVLAALLPLFIIGATWAMARIPFYFPENIQTLTAYLHLLVCGVVAPSLFVVLHAGFSRLRPKRRWAVLLANTLVVGMPLAVVAGWAYGVKVGFYQFEVRHVELAFDDLPEAFDGYKIVQFSDAHVGTLVNKRASILQCCVDSINAQHADMVVFTGDMQNMLFSEITPHRELLSSVKARDGVFAVMGNHDYAEYLDPENMDSREKLQFAERTANEIEMLGWTLLCNSNRVVRRGDARLGIAGMHNDGEGRFPQWGKVQDALLGLSRNDFVVMLEHDPTSWRRKILKGCHAQLTLSGHTHGGQLELFGWSPASWIYRECDGLYELNGRKLYVSKGLAGVVPFRLGAPGEIVVITLKHKD